MTTRNSPAFHIGPIPVWGDVILSPMDGFSDLPFRTLCRELGSALSYTEFINALDILQGHPFVHEKFAFLESERPVAFQLFDSDPQRLLEAALRLQEHRPDFIDINMGCSDRSVSGRGAGAGLLREPEKIAQIFTLLTHALEVPITGKIRLGWDDDTRNYLNVARIVQDNGGVFLAVHGRTRSQGFGGQADWDAIAQVKAALNIPVAANGDVRTVEDIQRIRQHTGCDAVLIGRGAIGNPWIFSGRDRESIPEEELRQVVQRHLQLSLDFHGSPRGLVLFRKHAQRYLGLNELESSVRKALLTSSEPQEFLDLLDRHVFGELAQKTEG